MPWLGGLTHICAEENVDTFFAQVEAETGTSLPAFVKEEFDAFLQLKKRGFCSACGARRI